ncbi:uracil-DNA glycosylase [Lactococcus hodotermopsidis]|uniref:Uracil-DNA glycosylase n=1 Tax=Pseudolactococcus hodotermopsidis TaxID=2709157 RepID=A0A6A0BFG6_9LACT|nr:uracil-DNA glycosylase [Lactococcus hodotermopsidis]GFH43506.1 uracil-DNA glycosylase [Lactococcus hodotermopsidis]
MKATIQGKWGELLNDELQNEVMRNLSRFIAMESFTKNIFPPKPLIFNALNLTDYNNVKVVLLGQDPYHGKGQAMGLSFSVPKNVPLPPSLRNIYKEIGDEFATPIQANGDLTSWAEQGVLLLNTALTVEEGKANSHAQKGWEGFTDKIISLLNERETPVIFLLLGRPAQSKSQLITNDRHKIITAPHPSPLSAHRGFFGSNVFRQVNTELEILGKVPVNWLSVTHN